MRVTLLNQFYPPDISPTANLCASLAEHRAKAGDEVTIVTSRAGYLGRLSSTAPGGPVRVRRLWSTRLGSRSIFRRLIDWGTFYISCLFRMATLRRQDVIISLTTPPYIALTALLHKALHPHTRLVLWNMDSYPEALERTGMLTEGGIISRLLRAANRLIFRQLDHLVCLDHAMQLLLSQYKQRDRQLPTSVIPNWERASLFQDNEPAEPWSDPIMEKLDGKFVVLYLGNAGYGHEFATILAAAEKLQNELIVFLFVGGGARRTWLAEEGRRRNLNNILLHGYVPAEQVRAILQTAGCALITLEIQMAGVMSPSKLHANLAAGLPILYIGPPDTNVDEAVIRFACGVSLRPGQVIETVEFLRYLQQDSATRAELTRSSLRAFTADYNDRRTLLQFDGIFESFDA